MPARDAAAVGLFLLALANLDLFAQEITFSDAGNHYAAIATLLLRDDYIFPADELERLMDAYAHVGTYKFHLYEVKSVPAELTNFHQWFVSIYL